MPCISHESVCIDTGPADTSGCPVPAAEVKTHDVAPVSFFRKPSADGAAQAVNTNAVTAGSWQGIFTPPDAGTSLPDSADLALASNHEYAAEREQRLALSTRIDKGRVGLRDQS